MIAELQRYPEYKESGLPWLGDIPKHWASERAKWLFTKMYRPVREEDEIVTCFRDGMVTLRKNRRLRGFTEATVFSGYQGIRKGDLVIHGMDAFAGAIGVSDSDGKGTPVYNVCQPRLDANASYYAQLVREMSQSQWILALAKGIRERSTDLRFEMFGNQRVPFPPPAEQAAIVRFLDWANGRLERAIRAKRKVIALLNEQKQAIIHRAVTRGLDPSVPLKPSGIPWLGDIPQHWDLGKVKRFFQTCSGSTPSSGQISLYYNGPFPWIRTMDLNNGIVDAYAVGITKRAIDDTACKVLPVGSVLVAMYGGAGTIGKNGLLAIEATTNQALCALLPSHQFQPQFVLFFMQYQRRYWMVGADGTRKDPNISQDRIRESAILLPPLPEQQRIVEYVERNTSGLQIAISRLEREIELLREYRTRLVADVVTGKLDVREEAARLPDEAAPDTGEDDSDLNIEPEPADEETGV